MRSGFPGGNDSGLQNIKGLVNNPHIVYSIADDPQSEVYSTDKALINNPDIVVDIDSQ